MKEDSSLHLPTYLPILAISAVSTSKWDWDDLGALGSLGKLIKLDFPGIKLFLEFSVLYFLYTFLI